MHGAGTAVSVAGWLLSAIAGSLLEVSAPPSLIGTFVLDVAASASTVTLDTGATLVGFARICGNT
jgi:hypothetical protein